MVLIPEKEIANRIIIVREKRVILDRDLAKLYGVSTKALNQAVKRNQQRFPEDFMFRLTKIEKEEVVTNCDHLRRLKFSPQLPYAFSEHGTLMLANVIKSPTAIEMSIAIVRIFVKLREMAISYTKLKKRIEAMERKYNQQFKVVFEAIKKLLEPIIEPEKPKRKIGFHAHNWYRHT